MPTVSRGRAGIPLFKAVAEIVLRITPKTAPLKTIRPWTVPSEKAMEEITTVGRKISPAPIKAAELLSDG